MSLRDLLEQAIQQQQLENQVRRDTAVQFTPSAGQVANVTGMLAPGAGIADAKGLYPSLGSFEQPFTEAFSNEPYPSMAENLERGGFGGYFDAIMQGLGVAGDALYAAPVVGPVLGATVGTGLKGLGALGAVAKATAKSSKSGKGITALDETKKMLQADVNTFAKDDLGFTSPTMEALITKAPANLKGKQITEWAKSEGATNKGVKPKELEFLGLDEFVAANPNATVRETIEGISGNKVKVSTNILSEDAGMPTIEFTNSTPLEDPLDGSKLYQHMIDDLKADINVGYEPDDDILRIYNAFSDEYGVAPIESFADMQKVDNEVLEASIDRSAKNDYMNDPYIRIQPQLQRHSIGTEISDETFAFGNGNVGYQLFVDGERVTNKDNIAYSESEAQIQLRNAIDESGGDPVRIAGYDDFADDGGTKWKGQVDNSLPGGSNYREVVFNWDNAPVRHGGFDHFDDDNQIAHALIRDRKLADGTDTLHGDEIQSDIHTKGSQDGYDTPENRAEMQTKANNAGKEFDEFFETFLEEELTPKINQSFRKGNISQDGLKAVNKQIDEFKQLGADRKIGVSEFLYFEDQLLNYDVGVGTSPTSQYRWDVMRLKSDELHTSLRDIDDLVPNYPYKKDYYDMALKKMLLLAIEEGKPAISVSGSAPMKARYSEEYAKFYETLYDKKIPSAMEKLSNKYGGEFYKGDLDAVDTFGPSTIDYDILDSNIIRITPEMKEKILKEGIQSFGTGGIVDSGITNLNTSKKKTDGIVAIATP